jgi:hypothetical protein
MSDRAKQLRRIRQLRALAASTTFEGERANAQAKADELEAQLVPEPPPEPPVPPGGFMPVGGADPAFTTTSNASVWSQNGVIWVRLG